MGTPAPTPHTAGKRALRVARRQPVAIPVPPRVRGALTMAALLASLISLLWVVALEIPVTDSRTALASSLLALSVQASRCLPGQASPLLLRSYRIRRACSCSSTITTKSRRHERGPAWSDGTVTLYGCSTVCTSAIPSAGYLSYLRNGCNVCSRSTAQSPSNIATVNGTHLAGDVAGFLEKRRKGLVRFANQLVQHPVLSQEQLVQMFLGVPTVSPIPSSRLHSTDADQYQELSVWRKQATISVQEEFAGKSLPPNLEDSLPSTLPELFEQVRAGVKRATDIYINLCVLLDRLVRRNEGLAADNLKFSLALQGLTESTSDTYAVDTNDVPLLNEGIGAVAKHMSSSQTLLEDEGGAWESHTLEDLKTIRDAMVSMRDVFDRRDRLAKDNIPQLERRIETSEGKLQQLRSKPSEQVKPGQIEKVESSIISDKESIVQQHARGVFIKECVRDEIVTFQSTIFAITRFHQDWAQERVKYAELQASNWKTLVDDIESMPMGD